MRDDLILTVGKLGFPWQTLDPFLFCVHHDDAYPAGNERLGVDPEQLHGRNIGMDFEIRDGWRMYHGDVAGELLMLQGRPIGEPVVQHGPFVMNTAAEIQQAYADYQATQFGGWPWPGDDPVHARDRGRFAIHADGREERAGG